MEGANKVRQFGNLARHTLGTFGANTVGAHLGQKMNWQVKWTHLAYHYVYIVSLFYSAGYPADRGTPRSVWSEVWSWEVSSWSSSTSEGSRAAGSWSSQNLRHCKVNISVVRIPVWCCVSVIILKLPPPLIYFVREIWTGKVWLSRYNINCILIRYIIENTDASCF